MIARLLSRRLRRDERGVSAIIVVLAITAIFSAAVLSVDAGSVWRSRRNLITDTDAAALAAARHLDAQGARSCVDPVIGAARDEATTVLAQNDPDSELTGFTITPTGGNCTADSGHVRVDARLSAYLSFAGIFGFGDVPVASSSIAQWGPLSATTGVRPVGICDKSEQFIAWTEHLAGNDTSWGVGPGYYTGPNGETIARIYFQRGPSGCGSASGNWDWLDFNGNVAPNGNTALREWLLSGFPGEISLGDPVTSRVKDCNPDEPGNQDGCDPKTGAGGGSFESSLEFLRDDGIAFPILVYNKVVDNRTPERCSAPPPWDGSGSNALFCHVAFLLVRIHGWSHITGQLDDRSYIDMEFLDEWWVGSIGGNPSGTTPTVHGVSLCGGGYSTTIDQKCDV